MTKKGLPNFKDFLDKMGPDNSTLKLTLNNVGFFVPEGTLKNGHIELRPVGFLYSLIRALRTR